VSVEASRSAVPALVAGWAVFTLANAQRIAVVPFFNEFRHDFGIDYAAAGGLLSAYLLGYLLAQIPAGLAADNLPTRHVTAAGLAMLALTSLLFAVSDRLGPAILLRGLMGVSAAALYSSTVKLTLGAAGRRGAAMGLLQSGAGTGMVVGLFAMPLLAQATSVRTAFVVLAAFSGATFVYALLYLPRGPSGPPAAEPLAVQLGRIVRRRHFVYLSACAALALFSAYGVTAWLPTYLRNAFGFTAASSGAVASLINVALLVASPLAGILSDRVDARASAVIIGFAVLAGAFALLVAVPGAVWVAVSAALAGIGLALTLPVLTTVTTEMFGIERAGVAISLNLAVGQVASTVSGVLLGSILDATGSFTRVWGVSLAVAACGIVPALGLRRLELSQAAGGHARPAAVSMLAHDDKGRSVP
jgi:MFS transporter, ACS family, hexuronate transporter